MSKKPEQKLVRFDWAMKNILRKKSNFDILEGFLTCLLNEKIKIESLLESESNKKRKDMKINRVDLKCKDSQGRQLIVEIQSERQRDYFERIAWSSSKALVESLDEGDGYAKIAKVISVSILYHKLYYPETNNDYIYEGNTDIRGRHSGARLLWEKSGHAVTSGEVFPEHYVICVNNFDENKKTFDPIDEWVYLFKKERVGKNFDAPGIEKATQKLNYLQMSKEEQQSYDAYVDAVRYESSVTDTAREEGRAEGELKGREEGREEGISIGERREKLETARRFLAMGLSVEQIADGTGLSEPEILALQNGK